MGGGAEVTTRWCVGAVFCVARTARSVSHVSERQRYVIEYFACSYSLFIHTRTHVFPTTTQTFVRSAVLVQLFELHPACVGETRVVFILSKLTAREVANSVSAAVSLLRRFFPIS